MCQLPSRSPLRTGIRSSLSLSNRSIVQVAYYSKILLENSKSVKEYELIHMMQFNARNRGFGPDFFGPYTRINLSIGNAHILIVSIVTGGSFMQFIACKQLNVEFTSERISFVYAINFRSTNRGKESWY